ncbi:MULTISPECIES: polysaccharide deacetylase family protein [Paenibacillus]|jgi:peptidoglycan/xylan/chitin deacetylase (PgdA/CDA1 family)|uniref:Polysaccharide deacetylase family protein n=1 Tax=Paenibacillus odorifer TaxID=189426 RepID=A0A1R0Z4D5_9BACL|nr:polysaccharide deacetylase family protein [Paenibacillus odorifer]AWV36382.1 polysaccharide deacetylase family protein [Paenibacillus odorifer]OMD13205.1 polysaccharide deacetylase family protein [Paenibacillus odorifer]OMD62515.1 polysaccharide deacetylase family protein [Paenibacillus odorifer]OMD84560.1 polysaccharide deacetylase family protein [Paenibacillus odorifer]OME17126.1 polysaccharide deacetylase family protein [Paenibacillus odorifer]
MWAFIILAVDVIVLYMIVPFALTRILGWGVHSEVGAEKEIAFTFDDGPDPCYTPELLDLLKEHGIKATFFVLGKKAQKYPELIERMHREGHQIGIHNYTHTPNWIQFPWTNRRKQVDRTADIVERITGERPIFYRPPWGLLNLGDFFLLRESYRIVLWSVMVGDWKASLSAEQLKDALIKKIKPGSIIVLHDSGDTPWADEEAPLNMITGLEEVLKEMDKKGLKCLRMDELLNKEVSYSREARSRVKHRGQIDL